MAEFGSLRLAPRGLSDAANGDLSGDFDDWLNKIFWPKISRGPKSQGAATDTGMHLEISTQPGVTSLRQDVQDGVVVEAKVLTAPGTPEKRHLEIELQPDMTYENGDYLAILPVNSNQNVRKVMKTFGLAWNSTIVIKGQRLGTLPLDTPLSIRDILAGYVELFEPVSKKVCTISNIFISHNLTTSIDAPNNSRFHNRRNHKTISQHSIHRFRNLRTRSPHQTSKHHHSPRNPPLSTPPLPLLPLFPLPPPRPLLQYLLLTTLLPKYMHNNLQRPQYPVSLRPRLLRRYLRYLSLLPSPRRSHKNLRSS